MGPFMGLGYIGRKIPVGSDYINANLITVSRNTKFLIVVLRNGDKDVLGSDYINTNPIMVSMNTKFLIVILHNGDEDVVGLDYINANLIMVSRNTKGLTVELHDGDKDIVHIGSDYMYINANLIMVTGRGSSIGSEFAWHASGLEFDPHVQHILSMPLLWTLGHENISTSMLPLPLIQEEQLSVTGERIRTKY